MESHEALEIELKNLIIEVLLLEDITPEEINSSEPLFVEGLGLDSIDALEIAMGLEQRYEIAPSEDPEDYERHFASVRSLALYVAENRKR